MKGKLMRIRVIASTVATIFALGSGSILIRAQAPETQNNKKIYGYQDTQTGAFHALAMDAPTANTSTVLGGRSRSF